MLLNQRFLNRLSELADEMSSFFLRLKAIEKENENEKTKGIIPAAPVDPMMNDIFLNDNDHKQEGSRAVTYADAVKNVIKGVRV